jgi:hypothetical protein
VFHFREQQHLDTLSELVGLFSLVQHENSGMQGYIPFIPLLGLHANHQLLT